MNRTARVVGALYIIGTGAGILSLVFAGSLLGETRYLTEISDHDNQFVVGTLFVLTMGLALALIPVLMFPILKKQNEVLALGYVIFRGALEMFTYMAAVIVWLVLLALSKGYTGDASTVSLADALQEAGDRIGNLTTIVFILGALMFYTLLYRANLIPRWLSGWGLAAAIPYLASGVLGLFGTIETDSTAGMLLVMPLALQEMVMAVWLIVKGFNASASPVTQGAYS